MGLLLSFSEKRSREFLKVRWRVCHGGHCYSCEPPSGGTVLVTGHEEWGVARGAGLEQEGKQASGMQSRGYSQGGGGREKTGRQDSVMGKAVEGGTPASTLLLGSRLSNGSLTF